MAKLIWEWKPRFAVALVVRGLLIGTSHNNCDVTSCPVVMRRYANTDGDEQRHKPSKLQNSLAFCKIMIVVECKRPRRPAQRSLLGLLYVYAANWCMTVFTLVVHVFSYRLVVSICTKKSTLYRNPLHENCPELCQFLFNRHNAKIRINIRVSFMSAKISRYFFITKRMYCHTMWIARYHSMIVSAL